MDYIRTDSNKPITAKVHYYATTSAGDAFGAGGGDAWVLRDDNSFMVHSINGNPDNMGRSRICIPVDKELYLNKIQVGDWFHYKSRAKAGTQGIQVSGRSRIKIVAEVTGECCNGD